MKLRITCENDSIIPFKKHRTDAGYDLRANIPENRTLDIYGGDTHLIGTGVRVEIPEGFCGIIVPRSSTGIKGLVLKNTIGIIDSDYRGEIKIPATNTSNKRISISAYERIAQLLIVPVALPELMIVDTLNDTERNEGGFGSTNIGC